MQEQVGIWAGHWAAGLALAFLFVLAILWFLLPFAVFGIKGKLDQVITELQSLNRAMHTQEFEQRVTNSMLSRAHNLKPDGTKKTVIVKNTSPPEKPTS